MIAMEEETKETDLKDSQNRQPADFEKAMELSGFGTFNILLVLAATPSCLATSFESSTMSYILPSAECDLQLTLLDKGILNGVTYAGMITSAVVWGYLADTKGRKNVLVFCYLADFVCVLGSSLSQNVTTLMIFKYFGGFVINGTLAILTSYLSELHGTKHRPRVTMIIGMLFSLATVFLPCIAWMILPQSINYQLIEGVIVIHSWQLFLAICALPSLIGGLLMMALPESPKFLMSQGRNEEALKVFEKIYAINHHKPRDTFPISVLLEEVPQKNHRRAKIHIIESGSENNSAEEKPKRSAAEAFREGLKQIRPMFMKPSLGHSILVCTLQFCILLGLNTIRLWLPQLFAFIADFEQSDQSEATNLCAIIEFSVNKTKLITDEPSVSCEVVASERMYINAIIVGFAGLFGYFIAGGLISALGAKGILRLIISGLSGMSMYWTTDSITTVVLSSIYVTVGGVGATSLIGIVVDLFPTALRTTIVSIMMMFGRLGALIGNILFPYFLSLGCIAPFVMVSSTMFMASALSTFLPYSKKSALK